MSGSFPTGRITLSEAQRIALTVTRDLELDPALTGIQVEAIVDPHVDSFLPPLHQYDETQWAPIESRILQEMEAA